MMVDVYVNILFLSDNLQRRTGGFSDLIDLLNTFVSCCCGCSAMLKCLLLRVVWWFDYANPFLKNYSDDTVNVETFVHPITKLVGVHRGLFEQQQPVRVLT